MDSRIGTITLSVRSPNARLALAAKQTLEAALPRVLAEFDRRLPHEVIVLRELQIDLRAIRTGRTDPDWTRQLEDALHTAIDESIREVRSPTSRPHSDHNVDDRAAWFASVGVYLAHAIVAEPGPEAWPFRGQTGQQAWDALRTESRGTMADALAAIARNAQLGFSNGASALALCTKLEQVFTAFVPPTISTTWLSPWQPQSKEGAPSPLSPHRGAIRNFEVVLGRPYEVVEWVELLRLAHAARSEPARLALLSLLFERRPPIRDADLRENLVEPGATRSWRSQAAGLLVIADRCTELLGELGLVYTNPGELRAVRWAIGRALAPAQVSRTDPLVLLFAHELPTAHPSELVWNEVDPEPLHRIALQHAAPFRTGDLSVWPTSDITYAMDSRLCVDALPSSPNVVERLVRRYQERVGEPPSSIEMLERGTSTHLDAILEVDLPALPESWRPAVRACASAIRAIMDDAGLSLPRLQNVHAVVEPMERGFGVHLASDVSSELARRIPSELTFGGHLILVSRS
ncbi:MAG: hypothetical protein AAGF12_09385 [Myxococcota bacterium]